MALKTTPMFLFTNTKKHWARIIWAGRESKPTMYEIHTCLSCRSMSIPKRYCLVDFESNATAFVQFNRLTNKHSQYLNKIIYLQHFRRHFYTECLELCYWSTTKVRGRDWPIRIRGCQRLFVKCCYVIQNTFCNGRKNLPRSRNFILIRFTPYWRC